MGTDFAAGREELATATRILAHHDLMGMFGHVSLLTEDPQTYLICPGAGLRKDLCRPSEVLALDLDAEFEPGRPLELYMHSEVHRLKPRIKSLVHVHSPALVALSGLADIPTELLMIHASFWPATMPTWDEAALVRDRESARRLIDLMGDSAIALLRWHGAVIVGETLQEAVMRAVLAEEHARQLLWAVSHGQPLAPVPEAVDRSKLYAAVLSPKTHQMHWDYASTYVPLAPGARAIAW